MEFDNNTPIYIQVIQDIKEDLVRGKLQLGDKLPSSRDLAIQYKINPNTANRIYRELELEQICYTKRGLGTFLTEETDMLRRIKDEMAEKLMGDFITGIKVIGMEKDDVLNELNKRL